MHKLKIFLTLFSIPFFLSAQDNHADCESALHLTEYNFSSPALKGYGKKLEISGNELGNLQFFTEEHNTIWLSFEADASGKMTFLIKPNNSADDYDFMLYRNLDGLCSDLNSNHPIRSNLARNNPSTDGSTGLSDQTINEFSAAGVHNNFSKWVEVNSGDKFMLVIDAIEESNSGFTLTIYIEAEQVEEIIYFENTENVADEFEFADMSDHTGDEKIEITFKVLREETKKEVDCHAEIIGIQWEDSTLVFDGQSTFSAMIPKGHWFFINVKKDGYTFGTEKYKASDELASEDQIIYISEVKTGNVIVLKEIVFRENTTHLLPSSINALEQLIDFMNDYPTAEIEVQGHVNAPGFDNDGKVKRFSLKRAEQIKEYLVGEGIEGRRVKVAGMGNEFMIYPNPKTYDEEKANRRVEIEILKY